MTELESEPRQPPLKKVRLNRPFLDQDYYDLAVASPEYAPISEILSDSESEEQDIMGKKSSRQITRDHPRFEETQAKTKEPEVYKSRGYQFEMLEESMQRNIIIAMETGSGKTHIAVLRIEFELNRCDPDQIVWFIAPTVPLSHQQHATISHQLPQFQTRLLTGADNVDFWSTQAIWDEVLHNIKIVVSTPQILLDAMSNGFVAMRKIALVVFDEAHNCVRNSASSRMMKQFYHASVEEKPHILGLTASPISSNVKGMSDLETTLDAMCKTPRRHYSEMMQYVHRPELIRMPFRTGDPFPTSQFLQSLKASYEAKSLDNDPDIKIYKASSNPRHKKKLDEIEQGKRLTGCSQQLKNLVNRSEHLMENLGLWASDTYTYSCLQKLAKSGDNAAATTNMINDNQMDNSDNVYMLDVLSSLRTLPAPPNEPTSITEKARVLLDFLCAEHTEAFSGIIFVQQRVVAKALVDLIALHPQTCRKFKPVCVIGDKSHVKSVDKFELHDQRTQVNAVSDLREGKINLIIATSVLEEGIDISACHVVICFDEILHLRAFIQRRGRARREDSKFVIFQKEGDDDEKMTKWSKLEEIMKRMYEDETRELKRIQDRELTEEEEYDHFVIESTGAHLMLSNSMERLLHFCSTLNFAYTDTRPDFVLTNASGETWEADVILPTVLGPQFRRFSGIQDWKTQKMAERDACFQACKALYASGILNDNLLPTHRHIDPYPKDVAKRKSFALAPAQFDPWYEVAAAWNQPGTFHLASIKDVSDFGLPDMLLVLPEPLAGTVPFTIFWNEERTLHLELQPRNTTFPPQLLHVGAKITHLLLKSSLPHRITENRLDFAFLVLPDIPLTEKSLQDWLGSASGRVPAEGLAKDEAFVSDPRNFEQLGLVEVVKGTIRPWTFNHVEWKKEPVGEKHRSDETGEVERELVDVLHVCGTEWPKRTDYLHPMSTDAERESTKLAHTHKKSLDVTLCEVQKLPLKYSKFSLFIPSILHKVEAQLIARRISDTILKDISIKDISRLVSALTASVARADTNYQRLEFLGDGILKVNASLQIASQNPYWHEGLLTAYKDTVISNSRLSDGAREVGVDNYIISEVFTGSKWHPRYRGDYQNLSAREDAPERELSTKTLADVMESLIGVASLEGDDFQKVTDCLRIFLPEIPWYSAQERIEKLNANFPEIQGNSLTFKVEAMIGYEFKKKSLLVEALTHPSWLESGTTYQRLEFIGDSVLDFLITPMLYNSPKQFHHHHMHLMRTTLANGSFLGYLCLDIGTDEERFEIIPGTANEVRTEKRLHRTHLWETMRHCSTSIREAQNKTFARFEDSKGIIDEALESSDTYPWCHFARLAIPKFFSDIIESLLGAIFVDSHGSWDECRAFLTRIGWTKAFDRIIRGDINVMHPKERLGTSSGIYTVNYHLQAIEDPESATTHYSCRVCFGDVVVGEAQNAESVFEAETLAADAGLRYLDEYGIESLKDVITNSGNGDVTEGIVNTESADQSVPSAVSSPHPPVVPYIMV